MKPVGVSRFCQKPLEVNMAKKFLLVLVLASVLAGGAWAQEKVSKITINGGFAMGNGTMQVVYNSAGHTKSEPKPASGAFVSGDYRLPMKLPLSVGGELGFFNCEDAKAGAIPILVRAAYHFSFNKIPKLDIYPLVKVGFALGIGDIGKELSGIAMALILASPTISHPSLAHLSKGGLIPMRFRKMAMSFRSRSP
jgi:hypothetical protein